MTALTDNHGASLDWTGLADPHAREERRRGAYAALFNTELGRLVLLDILIEAQVFGVRGPPTGVAGHADYDAGLRDRAVEIAELAGVDARHMADALITSNEGLLYDRPSDLPEL